jgi:hypothetical protein
VDQYQAYAQACQQIEVMDKLDKFAISHDLPTEGDNKDFMAESVNVGRYRAEPAYKIRV